MIHPDTLLTAAEVCDRYPLTPAMLFRWVRLGRVRPVRRSYLARLASLGKTTSDLRFVAGDIVRAIEVSSFDEPGSRRETTG